MSKLNKMSKLKLLLNTFLCFMILLCAKSTFGSWQRYEIDAQDSNLFAYHPVARSRSSDDGKTRAFDLEVVVFVEGDSYKHTSYLFLRHIFDARLYSDVYDNLEAVYFLNIGTDLEDALGKMCSEKLKISKHYVLVCLDGWKEIDRKDLVESIQNHGEEIERFDLFDENPGLNVYRFCAHSQKVVQFIKAKIPGSFCDSTQQENVGKESNSAENKSNSLALSEVHIEEEKAKFHKDFVTQEAARRLQEMQDEPPFLNMLDAGTRMLDSKGNSALHVAAEEGDDENLIYLIEKKKFDANQKNKWGSTALHFAAWNGHAKIVEYLLSLPNIEINAKNSLGSTPLYCAKKKGHKNIVRLLQQKGGEASTGVGQNACCTLM